MKQKKIKTSKHEIPVVAITAYAMAGDREKSILQGCDDYLEKPIRQQQLFTIIRKFLS